MRIVAVRAGLRTKLNQAEAPFRILIPEGGVSAIDAPGQPFYDPEADAALFDELESAVRPAPGRHVRRLPLHINDPAFARALVEEFLSMNLVDSGEARDVASCRH